VAASPAAQPASNAAQHHVAPVSISTLKLQCTSVSQRRLTQPGRLNANVNVKRLGKHPDDFAPLKDADAARIALGSQPGHVNLEYLIDGIATRIYLDWECYVPLELTEDVAAVRAAYHQKLGLVRARATEMQDKLRGIRPDVSYLMATRAPGIDPKHPTKLKISFRVFFQGLAMPYDKIPPLLEHLGQNDGFWDTSVYKPREQYLAGVYGAKSCADPRVLIPITEEGQPMVCSTCREKGRHGCSSCLLDPLPYTAQFIDPNWIVHLMAGPAPVIKGVPAAATSTPQAEASKQVEGAASSSSGAPLEAAPSTSTSVVHGAAIDDLTCIQYVRALTANIDRVHWDKRETWITIGLALKHAGNGTDLFYEDFIAGSKLSKKFNLDDCDKTWRSFKDCDPKVKPVTIGTLSHLSEQSNPEAHRLCTREFYSKVFSDELAIDTAKLSAAKDWQVVEYSKRYCKALDVHSFFGVLVQSNLGTGKTEITGNAILTFRPDSILIISPRYLYSVSVYER
jgi:hypothetical protein